jgi:hypothetical protein
MIKIQLYECMEDYAEAFNQYVQPKARNREQVFEWIDEKVEGMLKLEEDCKTDMAIRMANNGNFCSQAEQYKPLTDLQHAVQRKMVTLAEINSQKTVSLIRKYFDCLAYQTELILDELKGF